MHVPLALSGLAKLLSARPCRPVDGGPHEFVDRAGYNAAWRRRTARGSVNESRNAVNPHCNAQPILKPP